MTADQLSSLVSSFEHRIRQAISTIQNDLAQASLADWDVDLHGSRTNSAEHPGNELDGPGNDPTYNADKPDAAPDQPGSDLESERRPLWREADEVEDAGCASQQAVEPNDPAAASAIVEHPDAELDVSRIVELPSTTAQARLPQGPPALAKAPTVDSDRIREPEKTADGGEAPDEAADTPSGMAAAEADTPPPERDRTTRPGKQEGLSAHDYCVTNDGLMYGWNLETMRFNIRATAGETCKSAIQYDPDQKDEVYRAAIAGNGRVRVVRRANPGPASEPSNRLVHISPIHPSIDELGCPLCGS